ncbi:MAG: putative ABC transport system permease protein [Phenylobacterium sp.]|jgi:putative ABC transport system permease protein
MIKDTSVQDVQVKPANRLKKNLVRGFATAATLSVAVSQCRSVSVAIVITGLGITGLITFSVNQRKKQIGIRRALGGSKKQIVQFFRLEISLLTALGLALGVVLMVLLHYIMAEQSAGQSSIALLPLVVLIVAIWAIKLLACWLPARRAAKIAPGINL